MRLVSWDPFNDMDRTFNRIVRNTLAAMPQLSTDGNGTAKLEWTPSADISETDKEYLIRAALPAVKKEDIKVTFDAGMITIEGERRQQKEEKTERFHRVESAYGSFARSFSLPDDINAENIRCENKDGILTVHVPKTQAKKSETKQIKVE